MFSALTLFSGPYALLARWAVLGLACAALFGYGWFKGNEHGTEKLTKYVQEQALATQRVIVKQGAVTETVRTEYVNKVKVIKEKGNEITKLVPVYVTVADDDACHVNTGFRVVHDAAAGNIVPPPPSGTDATASGLTLSTSLGTVTQNYTTYHEVAERLRKLQQWTRDQYKATNGEELK